MAHSTTSVYIHFIFAVKYRRPLLDPAIRPDLYRKIREISEKYHPRCYLIAVRGVSDHLHMLVRIDGSTTMGDFVRNVKSGSSRWLNERNLGKGRFRWQNGYAAFSCDYRGVESVRKYIQRQEIHHREEDFAQEYRRLLRIHGIRYSDIDPDARLA